MKKYLEYLILNSEHGYCYDRIQINCRIDRGSLEYILPLDEIRQNCFDMEIVRASYLAKKANFLSTIKIIAPCRKGLDLLAEYAPSESRVSYLELARDSFLDEARAIALLRSESAAVRKKHPSKAEDDYFVYDSNLEPNPKKKRVDIISDSTYYFGHRTFRYVLYARYSKINGQSCFRSEWRLHSSDRIKNIIGIKEIPDLLRVDVEKTFNSMGKKYLDYAPNGIDLLKLGKWVRGRERRKKLSSRLELSMGVSAFQILSTFGYSYAGLAHGFKQLKEEIIKNYDKDNDFHNRILSLTNYGKFKAQGT